MIAMDSVDFFYKKELPVFKNLSLHLNGGHVYGLLGLNGAGKTSLLKMLAGLIAPKNGSVKVMGKKPFDREVQFYQDLFFLPDDFDLPDCTIETFADSYGWMYPKFNKQRFNEILQNFSLNPTMKLSSISFGERKKALLSFAFSLGCKMLLLDEPANGLDIPAMEVLRRLLIENHTDDGIVLISTHHINDIENHISGVIILNKNKIVLNKTLDEISSKFQVAIFSENELPSTVLYSEKKARGIKALFTSNDLLSGEIDLEFLFRASMNEEVVNAL
ncbi:MAG: ABC transporter ATP-binding protein [Fibrobacteres bacterium]|nr:ABC transporter ATP-binding protein [Fibrobacterota bacterium]